LGKSMSSTTTRNSEPFTSPSASSWCRWITPGNSS
jgi:hypothetical protein